MTTDNTQHANLYEQHEWKHSTQVAGIPWKNPVATASGTFQYAAVRWFYDVSQLGAVTTKGVSPVPLGRQPRHPNGRGTFQQHQRRRFAEPGR